jgi:hypothetical protein
MTSKFNLPNRESRAAFGVPLYRRNWTRDELISIFPKDKIRILDVGAGKYPFKARDFDEIITTDFDPDSDPTVTLDLTKAWPFDEESFDLVFASHVIEHFYPQDRDRLVMNIFNSMRSGALLFIRVPHQSSIQGTGWEHYSLFGTNGVTSLTHGQNPNLPQFELVSVGLAMGDLGRFYEQRTLMQLAIEAILNTSFRLTDQFLCYLVGGVSEVQFLLRKP